MVGCVFGGCWVWFDGGVVSGRRLEPEVRRAIAADLRNGWPMTEIARRRSVSYSAVRAIKAGVVHHNGRSVRGLRVEPADVVGPLGRGELSGAALRALEDFGFFRERYFGRLSTPWQEEAAYRVAGLLETPSKEFVVINAPPGSGKSTLFTHDIPAWLTCRDRGIRGMMMSASHGLAKRYTLALRTTLENPFLWLAEPELAELGLAVDAKAVLREEFGRFKPDQAAMWTNDAFIVEQVGGRALTHKEPTWTAYGPDSKFIGGRYRIVLADDLVDDASTRSLETIDRDRTMWDRVAEKRLEPAGVLLLQGQRIAPEDLYRYNLDKRDGDEARVHELCCSADVGRRYHHIVYRAHDESKCVGEHGTDAPYWPNGCLLDPRRLAWADLAAEQTNDLSTWLTVFQQEDADPAHLLVHPLWVSGGTDPETGEVFPGVWDNQRAMWELPAGCPNRTLTVASTDPSPTQMWANTCWVHSPELDLRWLVGLSRRAMQFPDFLSEHPDGSFSGLMEDWYVAAKEMGRPIRYWIIEANAAQRFITQIPYVTRWARSRRVTLVEHQTNRNKTDPKYGPKILGNLWRFGKVRLPGAQGGDTRVQSMKLVDEVKRWPKGRTDDCVMSEWFFEYRLPKLVQAWRRDQIRDGGSGLERPSWLSAVR